MHPFLLSLMLFMLVYAAGGILTLLFAESVARFAEDKIRAYTHVARQGMTKEGALALTKSLQVRDTFSIELELRDELLHRKGEYFLLSVPIMLLVWPVFLRESFTRYRSFDLKRIIP